MIKIINKKRHYGHRPVILKISPRSNSNNLRNLNPTDNVKMHLAIFSVLDFIGHPVLSVPVSIVSPKSVLAPKYGIVAPGTAIHKGLK